MQQTMQALQNELDSLRADNIKLYEKIKFVQSYPGRVRVCLCVCACLPVCVGAWMTVLHIGDIHVFDIMLLFRYFNQICGFSLCCRLEAVMTP